MQNFLITFLAFAALEMSHSADSDSKEKMSTYFVANPRALDYKFTGKKDKHSFGVELKENKQFHHTKTAEDGVRLGCYGHEQDGVKYSTHYVADGKGYRLVPHQGLITVYPKDGGPPRQASFVQSFNEDELRSANIRYFFPDGCQSPQLEIDTIAATARPTLKPAVQPSIPPPTKINEIPVPVEGTTNGGNSRTGRLREFGSHSGKEDPLVKSGGASGDPLDVKPLEGGGNTGSSVINPNASAGKNTPETAGVPDNTSDPNSKTGSGLEHPDNGGGTPKVDSRTATGTDITTPGHETATGHHQSGGVQHPVDVTANARTDLHKYIPTDPHPHGTTPFKQLDNKCSDTCCDDNRPQILMSRPTTGSCCKGVSKIIIPIEMDALGRIPMAEILEITSETKNVEMLQNLLKLVEKYKL